MTLHQLKIFECVARHLNITKASAALHISQPTVSQQLKLLEHEFGKKFLARLNQGVELTIEGREFLDAIRPLLADLENIAQKFKGKPDTYETVRLIVGGSQNLSCNVLPKLLMAFKERHPTVQSVLESDHSSTIEKRLLASELEIAVITSPSHFAKIVYEPYEEIELVAVCHPSNLLARKRLTLKELLECPLVLRGGGTTERVLVSSDYPMNVVLRCEASSAVETAVQLGMGVGVLYRHAVASGITSGSLRVLNVPELKEVRNKSFIIYQQGKALTPMAQKFLKMLQERKNSAIAITKDISRDYDYTPTEKAQMS
jgi:DNA-binding transcriptional LysR family regulator